MHDQRIESFIFARGGSKGVARKNLKLLAGTPLIAHAIVCAKACPSLGCVNVSTDDKEIATIARDWGADVPFIRPAELAADNSPEWAAWQHAVQTMADLGRPFDILVSLPPHLSFPFGPRMWKHVSRYSATGPKSMLLLPFVKLTEAHISIWCR